MFPGSCSERDVHADFRCSACDAVCRQGVQTDAGQQNRHSTKEAREKNDQPFASEHISELLLYRVDPRHGNARIELTELAAHKGSERRRVSCRSDFETYGSEWARHL